VKTFTLPAVSAIGLVASLLAPTQAAAFDTFGCYADIHDQCYLQEPNCTPEEYNDFLAWCDNPGVENTGRGIDAKAMPGGRTPATKRIVATKNFLLKKHAK